MADQTSDQSQTHPDVVGAVHEVMDVMRDEWPAAPLSVVTKVLVRDFHYADEEAADAAIFEAVCSGEVTMTWERSFSIEPKDMCLQVKESKE